MKPSRLRADARRRSGGGAYLVAGLVAAASGCGGTDVEDVLVIDTPSETLTVGDFVTLTATATGGSGLVTWSTSDDEIARVVLGTVEGLRPGAVQITASASGYVPTEITLRVLERPGGYTAEEVDYFTEIALGSEFGGASRVLRRWPAGSGPLVRINGAPTPQDRIVVDSVLAEINRLTDLDIEIVADFPTVEVHFVPESEFTDILPEAPAGNDGLVWLWWRADQTLIQSVVLVSTDVGQQTRTHLIREELTQMLGLLRDSFRYPESIFYQGFSTVDAYLPIDRTVIELLHRPEFSPGMTEPEAARTARRLLRDGGIVAAAAGTRGIAPEPSAADGPTGGDGSAAGGEGRVAGGERRAAAGEARAAGNGGGGSAVDRTPWRRGAAAPTVHIRRGGVSPTRCPPRPARAGACR